MGIYIFVIGAIVLSVVALVNNARQKRHAQKSAASAPRKPKKAKKKAAAPAQSVASLAETMAAQDAVVVPQAQRENFPENLSYLSPLKRAVIMAEILGKPRGLE